MLKFKVLLILFVIGVVLIGGTAFSEDSFPFDNRDIITIVTPFAAGGGTGMVARICAPYVEKYLEEMGGVSLTVLVEDMPGAGGQIGTEYVYKQKPDGLTLGMMPAGGPGQQVILGAKFDLDKITYIAQMELVPSCIVVNKKDNFKSFAEIMERSEETPILHGTTGYGSSEHINWLIFSELVKKYDRELNIDFVHYGGTSEGMAGLMRGEIETFSTSITGALPYVQSNEELEFLVVLDTKRYKLLPDVPCLSDEDFPEELCDLLTAINVTQRLFIGPPDIPENTQKILEEAFRKTSEDPEFQEIFLKSGHDIGFAPGEESGKFQILQTAWYKEYRDLLEPLF